MFKGRKVKKRVDHSVVKSWEKISDLGELPRNICGVYAIYFVWNYDKNDPDRHHKINSIKLYIGSSIDIKKRLQDHAYHLIKKDHNSQNVKKWYAKNNYSMKYAIIERCAPKEMMQKEGCHLNTWSGSCLLNMWTPNIEGDLRPWLEEAIKRNSYLKGFVINDKTGCKESCTIHKSGYARMCVVVNSSHREKGESKYFYKHRVAFWEKNGTYPELIRHKCNNPRCYNADHLVEGNYQDNALDKRGDFPKEFEVKWKEYSADVVRLSEHFESRWRRNCDLGGEKVSCLVYDWEKKLGLREKYPEIFRSSKNRRTNRGV